MCDGIRCKRGNCVVWEKVCDGIQQCNEGEDENEDACHAREEICNNSTSVICGKS